MLDFLKLLVPISKDAPTGVDPRQDSSFNSLYHQIKDKRTAARLIERKNMQQDSDAVQTKSIWNSVSELSIQLLTSSSKDIEVTAWLIEAQLRLAGFAGLRDGFQLLNGLIEQYWDALYPLLDEDGLEARLASLSGLNGDISEGTLIVPINSIQLTEGQTPGPFAAWQYTQALAARKSAKPTSANPTEITVEQIMTAASQTRVEFYRTLLNDLQTCIDEFSKLTNTLVQKCGINDAPPSSAIRNALNTCLEYVRLFSKDKLAVATPAAGTNTATNAQTTLAATTNENVMNRESALTTLLKVGDFFRTTEPHSPLSYIIEKAHRWGTMSLPQLYKELITDNQVLTQLSRLTGVEIEDKK